MPPIHPVLQLVGKPPILQVFDAASRVTNAQAVRGLLTRLKKSRDLVDLAAEYGWVGSEVLDAHLRNDWFNQDGKGWWPHLDDVEDILRLGFIKTVELLRRHRLPIDAYWLADQPSTGNVYVINRVSDVQITVDLHTPPPSGRPRHIVPSKSIFITRRMGSRIVTKAAGA